MSDSSVDPKDLVKPASASSSPDITVAICTWNRAELLARTLQSFEGLAVPTGLTWELVLVNNNSTDATDDVGAQYADRLPLRLIHEKQQGHAFSRNAGIAAARGQLLIWTDDDVQVDPNWLTHFWKVSQTEPQRSFWGGTIKPDFERSPPSWVSQNWEICARVYALREWSGVPEELTANNLPFGANFSIRTAIQRQFLYNTDFGRRGSGMRGFDEIDVFRRLLNAGHQGGWCPEAVVTHFIPSDRLTLAYLRRYFQGQGETWAIRGNCRMTPEVIRARLRKKWRAYYLRRVFRSPAQWLPKLIEASRLQGQLTALTDGLAQPQIDRAG